MNAGGHLSLTRCILVLAVAVVVAGGMCAEAQDAQAYLKVRRLSSARGSQVVVPSWGTHARDYSRSVSISIEVRGMGIASQATLEWYFIAKNNRSGELWIFDEGREALELDPKKLIEVQKTSKDLAASVSEYGTWMRVEGGSRVEGYVVRITTAGKVLAVAGSTKSLESQARDPAKWATLVERSEKIRETRSRERDLERPSP